MPLLLLLLLLLLTTTWRDDEDADTAAATSADDVTEAITFKTRGSRPLAATDNALDSLLRALFQTPHVLAPPRSCHHATEFGLQQHSCSASMQLWDVVVGDAGGIIN